MLFGVLTSLCGKKNRERNSQSDICMLIKQERKSGYHDLFKVTLENTVIMHEVKYLHCLPQYGNMVKKNLTTLFVSGLQ